jgi:hypothetical protein
MSRALGDRLTGKPSQKQYKSSEQHLLFSRKVFDSLSDQVCTAQVDETLARLHVALGDFERADNTVRRAIEGLESGGFEISPDYSWIHPKPGGPAKRSQAPPRSG